ncbi:hypothetical protein ACFE04_012315 [Oxalis oulophora]
MSLADFLSEKEIKLSGIRKHACVTDVLHNNVWLLPHAATEAFTEMVWGNVRSRCIMPIWLNKILIYQKKTFVFARELVSDHFTTDYDKLKLFHLKHLDFVGVFEFEVSAITVVNGICIVFASLCLKVKLHIRLFKHSAEYQKPPGCSANRESVFDSKCLLRFPLSRAFDINYAM